MPSCVVKWCKNNTTSQKKCQGITFHRFPTGNEPWKDDWIKIIMNCRGQEDWSASKSSVVCSIHFDQNDLYTTSKGRRRLVTYATRIKLFMNYTGWPGDRRPKKKIRSARIVILAFPHLLCSTLHSFFHTFFAAYLFDFIACLLDHEVLLKSSIALCSFYPTAKERFKKDIVLILPSIARLSIDRNKKYYSTF
ncbi:hypothetical protein ABMA28_009647 [Loxostege sticticalis]|uniref:THAP-type domain-containing protein n=1 Tax=Loxostege sticticalis TaxID=481309 RepID=A0ABD0SAZ3_LOXSC